MSFDESQLDKNKFKDEMMSAKGRQKPKLRASSSIKMEISADLLRSEGHRNWFWFLDWLFFWLMLGLRRTTSSSLLMLDPDFFDSLKAIEICTLFIKKKLNRMIGNFFSSPLGQKCIKLILTEHLANEPYLYSHCKVYDMPVGFKQRDALLQELLVIMGMWVYFHQITW